MARPRYAPEVQVIVSFEVASQACRDLAARGRERVRSVDLLGERLVVHRQRVDALAGNGPGPESS